MQSPTDPKDHPPVLYKYLRPERTDVLQNLRVRFTQPACFNDIFESFPGAPEIDMEEVAVGWAMRVGKVMAEHPEWTRRERRAFERDEYKRLNTRVKQEAKKSTPQRLCEEVQIRHSAVTGILCVSGKGDNILMWSHYTDDHRGYVIEFDGTHPFFNGIVEVHYSDNRPLFHPKTNGWCDPSVPHQELRLEVRTRISQVQKFWEGDAVT